MGAIFTIGIVLALGGGLQAQEPAGPLLAARSGPDPAWLVQGAREAAERAKAVAPRRTVWKASIVALIAASVVDAQSSWGKREANPVLANGAGRFGVQGVALKGLITGGALSAQWLMVRRHGNGAAEGRTAKIATIVNFATAGIYARVAVHNYGVDR